MLTQFIKGHIMLTVTDNNRAFARMDVDCGVRFKIVGANELCQGNLHNLSAEGVSFQTDKVLANDTEIFLEVSSGGRGTPPLLANAKVVRCCEALNGNFEVACTMKISA